MRKIILYIASSLDGYVARENGDVDWLPENVESGYNEFYKTIDTVVMGKTTYDQVLTFGEYPYKDKKSYVFTRNSNKKKDENVEFVSDVDKFVKDILPKLDETIWLVGGGQIISSFVNHGMIDEIILSIIPVVLGNGIPLFKNIQKETNLELAKTTSYDKLVELHYKVLK
ncbi:MAG: dihydrofolate reductase family protein [Nitrosopumilus sp.]|nr:dihydrofolate reductase family protein [Nitrosopumilus sp.]